MSVRTRASSPAGVTLFLRYLNEIFLTEYWVSGGLGVGSVSLHPIQIPFTVTVDRICFVCASVAAGNVRMAIYRDNGDTPVGGALIVETASVPALLDQKNEVPIVATRLNPGLYWIAFQYDDDALRFYNTDQAGRLPVGGTLQIHWFAYPYGPFPAVCPVTATNWPSFSPWHFLRVASVP